MKTFQRCPRCGKSGAYIKCGRQPNDDWWVCRYCRWTAHTDDVFDPITGKWDWAKLSPN